MILGILLLIFGLLITGRSAYMWYYYNPRFFSDRVKRYLLLFTILGGALTMGGIVRLVLN